MVLDTILAAHHFDVLELSCGSVVIRASYAREDVAAAGHYHGDKQK